ncbi:DHH family phosphoesterase [Trichloromonas sp.]|uniref:DHH family phosphoesterase n=1 Tax=Trichloromonas sp. TaxID=3069249 RepID=UPI002A428DAB|nr:DHH family phosphoesterase [Trichloromonas sp.]
MPLNLDHSRDFSGRFIEWMRGKGNILIVAHDNPDPDSLAAAMALQHLILVKTGQQATLTHGGIIGRGENRMMVQKLEIPIEPIESLDLDHFQVVCMVDTQPGTGNNSFPLTRPVHLVIDHHPPWGQCGQSRWVDIRDGYGASATILFEYLTAQGVTINTRLATILFYAIKSETQDLGREWSQADREAYLRLLPLANNRILFDITHPEVPREYFAAYSRAIRNARTYGSLLVFNLFAIDNPDMVAEMTDFLLRVDGIKYAFGIGYAQGMGIVSFRTLRQDLKSGELMKRVIGELGSGGGHGMVAGGQIRPLEGDPASLRRLERTLTRRLLDALGLPSGRGDRLV